MNQPVNQPMMLSKEQWVTMSRAFKTRHDTYEEYIEINIVRITWRKEMLAWFVKGERIVKIIESRRLFVEAMDISKGLSSIEISFENLLPPTEVQLRDYKAERAEEIK